jgi:hypothetical protein
MTTIATNESECTVFLQSKSAFIIFNYNYEKLNNDKEISYLEKKKLDFNSAEELLLCGENVVNLTEKDTINFKKNPPILIECASQGVLDLLLFFFPKRKFVLVYSWYVPNRYDGGEYDDYLDSLWDSSQQEVTSKYANNDGKVEVVQQLLNVYITDENKNESEDPWLDSRIETFNFPSCSASMLLASECGCGNIFDYDDLRIYEKEVFDTLKLEKVDGHVEYEGESFPIAQVLNLEVEKYKSKVILKH